MLSLLLVLVSALAAPIFAQQASTHGTFTNFTSSGASCSQGTVIFNPQRDRGAAYVLNSVKLFDAIAVQAKERSARCSLVSSLSGVQPGWQAAITRVTLEGELFLPPTGTISFTNTVAWTTPRNESTQVTLGGSYRDPGPRGYVGMIRISADTRGSEDTALWSPCGSDVVLGMNMRASVSRGNNYNDMALFGYDANDDGRDEPVRAVVEIEWRECE